MKLVAKVFSSLMVLTVLTGSAFAQVGVVDIQEVSEKYGKAQKLQHQVRVKDEELQTLKNNLLEQLKAGEKLSPVEKKNLEDKLNNQFASKFKEYREWALQQEQIIRGEVEYAIKQVSQTQKLDVVLPKQAVLDGGKDITTDVIQILNK